MKRNEAKNKFVYPNKLYARTKDNITLDISYAPQTMEAVEYVRTDAFIEKAAKWLNDKIEDYISSDGEWNVDFNIIEDFEKYMEGEQKPAEWSEDDQSSYNEICNLIYDNYRAEDASRLITWLNDIKDRVLPQPKQEWSEEDNMMLQYAIEHFERQKRNCVEGGGRKKAMQEFIDWLKSLRPQSQWRPSDEQMDALETAVSSLQSTALESLYNKLKKL